MAMSRTRSGCCATAPTGHAAAPPPITLMKSRRLMAARGLERGWCHSHVHSGRGNAGGRDVRCGSKVDMCSAPAHVRFAPDSERESGLPEKIVSALPTKADMCGALADVCYGPIADIPHV